MENLSNYTLSRKHSCICPVFRCLWQLSKSAADKKPSPSIYLQNLCVFVFVYVCERSPHLAQNQKKQLKTVGNIVCK